MATAQREPVRRPALTHDRHLGRRAAMTAMRTIAACLSGSLLSSSSTVAAPNPSPSPATSMAAGEAWEHLRLSVNSLNFSHDPSGYNGPRSAYFTTGWTTGHGTLLQARFYLDSYLPREVAGKRTDPELTFANFEKSVKEIFVRHRFANGLEVTAGDIRATAHSDNNKALYAGDGKPVHSDIVELDRVLGASLAKDWPWGKVEVTISDRGRKDLRFDGSMEALRVSRASKDKRRQVQVSFVNKDGSDAGGKAARRQWQAGVGGSVSTSDGVNVFSGEYVHGNFFPGRMDSTEAFTVSYERKLMKNGALAAVVDYEHINGDTGVRFYETGLGANAAKLGRDIWLRLEGGFRYVDPSAAGTRPQKGPFVRVGIAFDRGNGSVKAPATLAEALRTPTPAPSPGPASSH
jgi:hypothetical protein